MDDSSGNFKEWPCPLALGHLEIFPTGEVLACCASNTPEAFGNLYEESLESVFESEERGIFLQNFLEGKGFANKHCLSCKYQENSGVRSARQFESRVWEEKNLPNTFLKPEGDLVSLGIRFSNSCNFSCRSCGPSTSTKWFSDAKFLHPQGTYKKLVSAPESNTLVDQVTPLLHKNLKRIYFAGGEPLLEKDHYALLKNIVSINPDLKLEYDTNLSLLSFGKENVLDYWKKCRDLYVSVSLDGLGKEVEYIRKGLEWETFLQNLEELKRECPNAKLGINFVLSNYNLLHLLDFLDELSEPSSPLYGIPLNFSLCEIPKWLNPSELPNDLKNIIISRYKSYADKTPHKKFADGLAYYIDFLNSQNTQDNTALKLFFRNTKALDFLRQESFDQIFPEISGLFHSYA